MNPSQLIDDHIKTLTDWRGETLAQLRKLIHEVDPDISEEWKWGIPVFSHKGLVCSLGAFKNHVKMHFFKGTSLEDKHKLFNAGLNAKAMRAIDFHESDEVDMKALRGLIRAAVAHNVSGKK
ncbi:MAG: DUF1801 domain-containing protein [Actinomycetota bacterium]